VADSGLSLNFPKRDKRSTCLVADSGLSLNFPKGTKGLTCPAGINMLALLVADSVLSLKIRILH